MGLSRDLVYVPADFFEALSWEKINIIQLQEETILVHIWFPVLKWPMLQKLSLSPCCPALIWWGKRNKLHISGRRKSFASKKKTCPGVLGAASAGAWLVHSLTPEAPGKPEWDSMAGQVWWLGSTGRGSALQMPSGFHMCSVSSCPGWREMWRWNGVRLFWWMQSWGIPHLPPSWELWCCRKDCHKKGFKSETILYVRDLKKKKIHLLTK